MTMKNAVLILFLASGTLVSGTNTLIISVASGSSGDKFLVSFIICACDGNLIPLPTVAERRVRRRCIVLKKEKLPATAFFFCYIYICWNETNP
jgi:hypothetical protein